MSTSLLIDGPGMWAFHYQFDWGKHKVTFGRSRGNDLVLQDTEVSSRHGHFIHEQNDWVVVDFGSSNGTYINGLNQPRSIIKNGDIIRAGNTDMVFQEKANPTEDEDIWGRTAVRISRHEKDLLQAVDSARQRKSQVIQVPNLHLDPAEENKQTFDPAADNMDIWVAEQLAAILGEIASKKNKPINELMKIALAEIQQRINAENGFLMIPDTDNQRWIIHAWVGDHSRWTDYQKKHPVSLTLANESFRDDRLMTNSFRADTDPLSSPSMIKLDVKYYLAQPLRKGGQKAGLLYFDKRNDKAQPFAQHDAKLFQQVGEYLLELNSIAG